MFVGPRRPVRSSGRLVRRGPRSRTIWASLQQTGQTLASGATVSTDLLQALEIAGGTVYGSTVLRHHFTLDCSAATTDTGPGIMWGTIVFDRIVTNKPNPTTETNADWTHLALMAPGCDSGLVIGSSALYGRVTDSRARRIVHGLDDSFFFIANNLGSTTITYSLLSRVLLKMP
jgi:hypothetical protein